MTIRIEVLWKLDNLRATAERLFERTPDVVGREPLRDVADAEQFLLRRLRRQLDGEPLEAVAFDTITVYKGYWAHLVLGSEPVQSGDTLASEVAGVRFAVRGTATPGLHFDQFTIERPSADTASRVAHVTFLVDLTPDSKVSGPPAQ